MPDRPELLRFTPPRHLKAGGIALLCLAFIVAAWGLASRVIADQDVAGWTAAQAVPTVRVVNLAGVAPTHLLLLPGDIEAYFSAPVHARATGYLKRWYTDIGAKVKAGQVLAEIDTPDLDQQLAQAKANLATAIANQKLAELEAHRYRTLGAQNAIAQELVDEKVGALEADVAASAAARANVRQLEAQESFKKIVAPFDGVVTSRATDVGALITVGTPTDVPLFTVADEHKLRVYVHVPQNYSAAVRPGLSASFTVPQFPGRSFAAALTATAEAVDVQSGTLLAEFQVDNADGALKPGDYAQMRIVVPSDASTLMVPASALIFRENGMAVATVDARSRVVMKPIAIGRDLGASVEVSSGLARSDRVVDNPPDSLRDGDPVRIAARR